MTRQGWDPTVTRMVDAFAAFFLLVNQVPIEPFQRLIVYELFRAPGQASLLVVIPRGNGKTTLFATLALWQLMGTVRRPEIYLAASTKRQARTALKIGTNLIHQHPELMRRFVIRPGYGEIRRRPKHLWNQALQIISSEGDSAHGIENMSLGLVDELHAARDGNLYGALVTGMGKRPDSKLVSITTVGADITGKLGDLWRSLDDLPVKEHHSGDSEYGRVRIHRSADGSFVALVWALTEHDDLTDPAVLKQVNPATFVTIDWLRRQITAPDVHPVEVARYHANVWMAGDADFLPPELWDRLDYGPETATLPDGSPAWLGIDIGITRDSSAVVAVGPHPEADHLLIPHLQAFAAEWGRKVRFDDVRDGIDAYLDRFDVVGIALDRYAFASEAERLEDEHNIPVVITPMTNEVAVPATSDLYDDIVSELIIHDGDPVLGAHVKGAAVKSTPRGLRIDKGRGRRLNDGAVAMMLAHREARGQGFNAIDFEFEWGHRR